MTAPSPRRAPRALTAGEATELRRLLCADYSTCVDIAIARRWAGFTCSSCAAYKAPSAERRADDFGGLLWCALVLGVATVGDE